MILVPGYNTEIYYNMLRSCARLIEAAGKGLIIVDLSYNEAEDKVERLTEALDFADSEGAVVIVASLAKESALCGKDDNVGMLLARSNVFFCQLPMYSGEFNDLLVRVLKLNKKTE
ncbi:MAG: hypothetical protein NUV82_03935 [Candidatus Komeilibacteria bacterium]|nr:hypothetical protein [Candidatus Komeilibacteria bacterium]